MRNLELLQNLTLVRNLELFRSAEARPVRLACPSFRPGPWRYRQAVGGLRAARLVPLTVVVGVGYFFVWTVLGMAAFPVGLALAAVEMQQPALARAVPVAVGVVVDLRAMAVVTGAISVERLAPAGERVAGAIGAVIVGAGLFLISRAAGLG